MKRVKDCKDVSIMSPQDEQWRLTSLLCLFTAISCFTKYNRMQSKHKQTNCEHSRWNPYKLQFSPVGITILSQRNNWKDLIEFVTEFPCLLGHPVEHDSNFSAFAKYYSLQLFLGF